MNLLYKKVKLIKDFKKYKKGTVGIIVEIYENNLVYLEILDDDGDTIGMLYDVPLESLEKI